MMTLEWREVELDFCSACRGSWLDHGELDLLLGRPTSFSRDWKDARATIGRRRCPRCAQKMLAGVLPGTTVELDACPADHGLWLDEGEMQAISRATCPPEQAAALAGFFDELFGGKAARDARKNEPAGGKK